MGDPRLNLQQTLAINASIKALSALDLSALNDVGTDESVVWQMLNDAIKPTAGAATDVMVDAVHEIAEAYGEGRIDVAVALQQQAVAKMERRLREESAVVSVARSAGRFGDGSAYRPATAGFPVMDAADLKRGIAEKSFEFIGFVRMEDGSVVPEALFRRDLPGIFVSTRGGMVGGMAAMFSDDVLTPDTLDEYEMGIFVDAATQKAQGIVVKYDSVYTESKAVEQWPEDRDETGEPERSDFIILRLDSITGPETHERVRKLHNFVADLLEAGAQVLTVERMVLSYQRSIGDGQAREIDLCGLAGDPAYESLKLVIRRHFPGVDLDESPAAQAAAAAPGVRGLIGGLLVLEGPSTEETMSPSAAPASAAVPAIDSSAIIAGGAVGIPAVQIMPVIPASDAPAIIK